MFLLFWQRLLFFKLFEFRFAAYCLIVATVVAAALFPFGAFARAITPVSIQVREQFSSLTWFLFLINLFPLNTCINISSIFITIVVGVIIAIPAKCENLRFSHWFSLGTWTNQQTSVHATATGLSFGMCARLYRIVNYCTFLVFLHAYLAVYMYIYIFELRNQDTVNESTTAAAMKTTEFFSIFAFIQFSDRWRKQRNRKTTLTEFKTV